MGLDMYMRRKIYVGANYKHNKISGKISIKKDGVPIKIDLSKVTYIEQDCGYWCKANQIHKWFVDNVQEGVDDCGEYSVSKEQLLSLLDTCKKVLEASELKDGAIKNGERLEGDVWIPIIEDGKEITDPKTAEELLPTQSGFFFGGTDYDEYYYQDIKDTIEIIENILKEEDPAKDYFQNEYYYRSSW